RLGGAHDSVVRHRRRREPHRAAISPSSSVLEKWQDAPHHLGLAHHGRSLLRDDRACRPAEPFPGPAHRVIVLITVIPDSTGQTAGCRSSLHPAIDPRFLRLRTREPPSHPAPLQPGTLWLLPDGPRPPGVRGLLVTNCPRTISAIARQVDDDAGLLR